MRRFGTPAVAAVAVPITALILLAMTGALTPTPIPGLPDPGVSVRVALPVVQGVRDLAAICTVGFLALAALCVPPESSGQRDEIGGARSRLVNSALLTASVWAALNVLLVALVYADASGASPSSPGFAREAAFFAQEFELGRYLMWGAALAGIVAVGCAFARRFSTVGVLLLVSLAALWPTALTGHAAGSLNHDDAVNLQAVHLLAVAVWLGGLLGLVVSRRHLGAHLVPTVRRYSTLAAWSLVLVTTSGLVGAALRLQRVDAIWSSYGAMLALKIGAVSVAAGLGWWQRRRLIDQLAEGRDGAFARLAGLEAVVLAGAAGAGVALSRTAPPAPPGPEQPLTAAESLIGATLPPVLRTGEWFTQWSIDSLWLPVGIAAIGWYLLSVMRLKRRGDSWPPLRAVCWVVGWLLFLWATNGAPGAYGRVLFSMHMVEHMTIATAVPVFLVLGAPATLALRTIRRRTDDSYGPREWILRVLHSMPIQILGHPLVAAGLFIVSIVAFYYGPMFEASLESHTAHVLMVVHFLLTGYLFADNIVGVDPGPERAQYPLRALLLMVTFGFHALFSVSLMASDQVLAGGWFSSLGRTWGDSLIDDQYLGASLGWALGEYPLAILAVSLVISWVHSDRRERRRFDRREDRDGGQQTEAYNAYLGRLGGRSASRSPSSPDAPGATRVDESR